MLLPRVDNMYFKIYDKVVPFCFFHRINYNIEWSNELLHKETGKLVKLKRSMAYVSDLEAVYYYDKFQLPVQKWTNLLLCFKYAIDVLTNCQNNSVLLNKYNDGRDKINWHSDKEEQLGVNPTISCLNFGATRQFWFLNKETGEKTAYPLSSGDVLVMGPLCQKNFLHAILPEKSVTEPRISLTFRKVVI